MKKMYLVLAAVALAALGSAVGYRYFLPQASISVDQPIEEAELVKSGSFSGADSFHRVSGEVSLYRRDDGSHFLRFESYDATAGPDVYFYLTEGDTYTAESIEGNSLKILVPGTNDGQATLRGNFSIDLPAGFNPEEYSSLLVWCDSFNVLFGYAMFA